MVVTRQLATELCGELSNSAHTIVFTNGCFDIIHAGHVRYLAAAKQLGDVLIVGLNSDASVRRLKGPERPVNIQDDRATVLDALAAVDYVCIFDEDTPLELIGAVQPNVLVKGGDWEIDQIVGAEMVMARGGKVCTIPYVAGKSTTNIIEKIRT